MPSPILITGLHRSGTTWVGEVLSQADETEYIHEPFYPEKSRENFKYQRKCSARFPYWYTYVDEENEALYLKAYEEMLLNTGASRAILKDPLALFSAPWLAQRFAASVLILYRHPLGFVSSLKINQMIPPFADILAQPRFLEDVSPKLRSEIDTLQSNPNASLVEAAALFWNLGMSRIRFYQDQYPDWLYLPYESLFEQPESAFVSLCGRLELNPNKEMLAAAANAKPISHTEIKARLTESEIAHVLESTRDYGENFYPDERINK